jgi:hypothetical protein
LCSTLVAAAGTIPAYHNLIGLHLSAHLLENLDKTLNAPDGLAIGGNARVYDISSEIHVQGINNYNSLHIFILPTSSSLIV